MAKRISLREWIEAAIIFTAPECEVCGAPLHQIWIGDEAEPDLHFLSCIDCEAEYMIRVAYVRREDIPDD